MLSTINLLALFALLPVSAFQLIEQERLLSVVPSSMNVSKVLYASEEISGLGFLPGDNETGVIVYEMPDALADALSENAQAHFEALPDDTGRRPQDRHLVWLETPVADDERWPVPSDVHGPWDGHRRIRDYTDQYVLTAEIEPSVEALANEALSRPGSYYAHTYFGVLILIPESKRIIYAYSG
jgi:hypothetical protein